MKRIIVLVMVAAVSFAMASCGLSGGTLNSVSNNTANNTPTSLNEIQTFVKEAQTAFESGDVAGAEKGISGLIEISNNPLYSESERLSAQYCATYINAGIMLDYIIKNDNAWLESHDVGEFDILYGFVFTEIVNGEITHIDTLKGYVMGLVGATQEIYYHYQELTEG